MHSTILDGARLSCTRFVRTHSSLFFLLFQMQFNVCCSNSLFICISSSYLLILAVLPIISWSFSHSITCLVVSFPFANPIYFHPCSHQFNHFLDTTVTYRPGNLLSLQKRSIVTVIWLTETIRTFFHLRKVDFGETTL